MNTLVATMNTMRRPNWSETLPQTGVLAIEVSR